MTKQTSLDNAPFTTTKAAKKITDKQQMHRHIAWRIAQELHDGDVTVLGALQVDEHGNIANWIVPGKMAPGMGGAMDLVVGAKKIIIAMEHTAKGNYKLLRNCTLPLTAINQVDMIVTEMGAITITPEGMELTEIASGYTLEEVQAATEAQLIISDQLRIMRQPSH